MSGKILKRMFAARMFLTKPEYGWAKRLVIGEPIPDTKLFLVVCYNCQRPMKRRKGRVGRFQKCSDCKKNGGMTTAGARHYGKPCRSRRQRPNYARSST